MPEPLGEARGGDGNLRHQLPSAAYSAFGATEPTTTRPSSVMQRREQGALQQVTRAPGAAHRGQDVEHPAHLTGSGGGARGELGDDHGGPSGADDPGFRRRGSLVRGAPETLLVAGQRLVGLRGGPLSDLGAWGWVEAERGGGRGGWIERGEADLEGGVLTVPGKDLDTGRYVGLAVDRDMHRLHQRTSVLRLEHELVRVPAGHDRRPVRAHLGGGGDRREGGIRGLLRSHRSAVRQ